MSHVMSASPSRKTNKEYKEYPETMKNNSVNVTLSNVTEMDLGRFDEVAARTLRGETKICNHIRVLRKPRDRQRSSQRRPE